jgi:hypothetical protein
MGRGLKQGGSLLLRYAFVNMKSVAPLRQDFALAWICHWVPFSVDHPAQRSARASLCEYK